MKKGQKVFVVFPEFSIEDEYPIEASRHFGTSFVVQEGELLHERETDCIVLFPKVDKVHRLHRSDIFEKKEHAQHKVDMENAELLTKLAKIGDTQCESIERLEDNVVNLIERVEKLEKGKKENVGWQKPAMFIFGMVVIVILIAELLSL